MTGPSGWRTSDEYGGHDDRPPDPLDQELGLSRHDRGSQVDEKDIGLNDVVDLTSQAASLLEGVEMQRARDRRTNSYNSIHSIYRQIEDINDELVRIQEDEAGIAWEFRVGKPRFHTRFIEAYNAILCLSWHGHTQDDLTRGLYVESVEVEGLTVLDMLNGKEPKRRTVGSLTWNSDERVWQSAETGINFEMDYEKSAARLWLVMGDWRKELREPNNALGQPDAIGAHNGVNL